MIKGNGRDESICLHGLPANMLLATHGRRESTWTLDSQKQCEIDASIASETGSYLRIHLRPSLPLFVGFAKVRK